MPYIRLASTLAMVTSVVHMTYSFPSVQEDDNDDAVHLVLIVMHSRPSQRKPAPEDCCNALFHIFCGKMSDDWTHGGIPEDPVMHVSDVFNRTLWHMHTYHPNKEQFFLMSKLSKNMPKITHPQDMNNVRNA
jgi:hypothetical protein